MQIPALTIVFMVISGLISIVVPIALVIVLAVKYKAKVVPALVGAAAFVVFALVLESLLHNILLSPGADGTNPIRSNPWIFVPYAALAAGVFEETARFISFHILKKKYSGVRNALSYGAGHGGIEAILLTGLTMVSNITTVLMLNSGALEAALKLTPGNQLTVEQVYNQFISIPSYMFLIGGFERILAIIVHITLSVVVYYSVTAKGKGYLFPVAILLHALVDVPAAMMQAGVIQNALVVEGILVLMDVLLIIFAVSLSRKLEPKPSVTDSPPTEYLPQS